MNSSMKEVVKVLLVIAILAGGAFCASSDVWGQDKGASLAKQIQGTWILVSIVNEKDGKKTEPFGPNPKGLII